MKLPNASRFFVKSLMTVAVSITAMTMSSCDSLIYDDMSDCSTHYRVSLRYVKNILDADAFGSQVTEVNLALYDKQGNMVLHKKEQRTPTPENNFYIEVDVLPGTYDIVAWCEGKSVTEDAVSFLLSGQDNGSLRQSGASLPLQEGTSGKFSGKDINRLYYGMERDVEFIDKFGVIDIEPVYLTKDTNHITISLQNVDGSVLDPDIISFELEGSNSELDWNNSLVGNAEFKYVPWSMVPTFAVTGAETKADPVANGVKAELTTGRIMADVEQILTVKRTDTGETIFKIPLVEYLMLVRNEYQQATSDQDYLDRYDDFTMVFFLQDGYTWIKTRILINGWRVVPPQHGNL